MFHAEDAEIAEANPATGPVVAGLGVWIQGPWPDEEGGTSLRPEPVYNARLVAGPASAISAFSA